MNFRIPCNIYIWCSQTLSIIQPSAAWSDKIFENLWRSFGCNIFAQWCDNSVLSNYKTVQFDRYPAARDGLSSLDGYLSAFSQYHVFRQWTRWVCTYSSTFLYFLTEFWSNWTRWVIFVSRLVMLCSSSFGFEKIIQQKILFHHMIGITSGWVSSCVGSEWELVLRLTA